MSEPPSHSLRLQVLEQLALAPWLRRIHGNELEALVVRRWYAPELTRSLVTKLEAMPGHPLWQHRDHPDPRRLQTRTLGQPTSPSDVHRGGAELARYFGAAAEFRQLLSDLFPLEQPFEPRLAELLTALSGGAEVAPARSAAGEPYGVATVRCIPPGSGLPPHCENDYMTIPVHAALQGAVQVSQLMSFFMLLAPADDGGELIVHERSWSGPSGSGKLAELMAEPHLKVELGPGDLVIFPAGRRFHSVLPVQGSRARWTLGGFCGFSPDESRLLYWA